VSKKNIHVVMDPLSEFLLLGTTIDYTTTAFENKFIFMPDKELASSFTPKH